MTRAYLAALLSLALTAPATALPTRGDAPDEMGAPRAGKALRDRDFGVSTRQFGLDRVVEMYQWRATQGGYTRVWNSAPIDSAGFAPGHENPGRLPLESRRWWAQDATIDGRPIAPEVLQTLGQWRVFRPNFSRLPANLAASFQPEGDGLGSAENPLEPNIGDLRIHWRELHLPPLDGKVELRDGRWQLAPGAAAEALSAARASTVVELPPNQDRKLLPWLLAGTLVLVAGGLAWRRVRRRR
jgi:hypothetical protein